jgi:hypothetical protein
MSGGGGGGGGGLFSDPLTLALVAGTAIAAPYAAPLLFEGGALAGSTMLGAGVTGMGIGGLGGALMGRDPMQMGLMGGLGGAAAAGMGVGAGVEAGGPQLVDAVSGPISGVGASGVGPTVAGAGTSLIPGISNTALGIGAGGLGLMGLMNAEKKQYGVPSNSQVNWNGGSLSGFRYDPQQYGPDVARPPNPPYQAQYADRRNPPNTVTPMAPYQPVMMAAGGEINTNPSIQQTIDFNRARYAQEMANNQPQDLGPLQTIHGTVDKFVRLMGGQGMASGGLADLGSYSDGGRMLKGPGDGMSDSIPATIGKKQPARLADNEFVVPADVVSHLGNGSSDAGAKKLYAMMNNVRKARTGKKKQAPQINAAKYMPA